MGARRELVEIHAKSNLAQVAARDAAAVRGLANSADSLSDSAVQTDRDTQRMNRSLSQTSSAVSGSDQSIRRQSDTINQLTGRIRVLADVAAILGPALAPIGVLAVPAVAGLANQLGFAAAAAGTAVLAFQGVGDAVTAMNDYALAPTADNAAKVEEALTKMSPAAVQFAREISGMRDQFAATRDAAAEGLFPGLTASLDDLDGLLGRVQPVLREIGAATGEVVGNGLESLNSDRWQPFFDFLQSEARPVLVELGATVGDFGHGLANLWMAFQPLNRDFSGWIRDVASSFDGWSAGLAETEGFNDFIAYIRESGPQVADALGALGGALVDIVTAASPLGGPILAGIEGFAKAVSAIADSPVGPVLLTAAAALALFNRTMAAGTRIAAGNFFATTAANVGVLTSGMQRAQTQAIGLRSSLAAISANRGAVASGAGVVPAWINNSQAATQAQTLATNAAAARANLIGMAGAAGRVAGPMAGLALSMSGAGKDIMGVNTATMALYGSMAGPIGAAVGGLIGLIQDLAGANDDLVSATQQAADAMDSGSVRDMEREYRSLLNTMAESEDTGGFWESTFGGGIAEKAMSRLTGATADGEKQLYKLGGAMTEAGGNTVAYASETQRAAGAAAAAAANVARLATNMRAQASAALEAFDAQTAWGQAVEDARKQAGSGAKGIDAMTQAGRDNRGALSGLASAWNNMSPAVKNNIDRYQQARGTFVDVAKQMGLSAGEARNLSRRMLEVPKRVLTKVDADVRQANKGLGLTDREIGKLSKRVAKPKVVPEISKAQRSLGNMRGRLDEIGSQRVRPTIDANDRPAQNKLRNLNAANRRFNGSRWQSNLDLNDAPANRKLGGANRGMSKFAGLTARGTADVNDSPAQGKLRGVDGAMKRTGGLKATTNVDANTAGANSNLSGHASYLSGINGRTANTYVNNYITTVRRTRTERAAGGAVYSRRQAGLLSGPGTSTSDSIPVEASNGEYFTRAKAVQHYGVGVYDLMNDMRIDRRALVEAASRSSSGQQRVDVRVAASGALSGPNGENVPLEMLVEEAVDRRMLDWDRDDFNAIHGRG